MHNPPPRLVIDFNKSNELAQKFLIQHVTNLLADYGTDPLHVEIIMYGPAIVLLTKPESIFAHKVTELQNLGVQFYACQNAMRNHAIAEDQLLRHVGTVPSGIGYIVKKQFEGYAYLKG